MRGPREKHTQQSKPPQNFIFKSFSKIMPLLDEFFYGLFDGEGLTQISKNRSVLKMAKPCSFGTVKLISME